MRPLEIYAGGMATNLGLSRAATAAAYRAQLDNFTETRFMDSNGEWLVGAEIPLERPIRGWSKLLELAARTISETFDELGAGHSIRKRMDIPLLLCIPGEERIGRIIGDEQRFFAELQDRVGMVFSKESCIISQGKESITAAIAMAETLLYDRNIDYVLVTAIDSLLTARTLRSYDDKSLLLTRTTSNGFVPGEGAASVMLVRSMKSESEKAVRILGVGHGNQKRRKSYQEPILADGLKKAIITALTSANLPMSKIGFWFYDNDSAYEAVKEATLNELRLLRGENVLINRHSPIRQFGETGIVCLLLMLNLYSEICEAGVCGLFTTATGDNDFRVAMVVQKVGEE